MRPSYAVIARSVSDEAIQTAVQNLWPTLVNRTARLVCFAELVIGPATSGRTRWLAMTKERKEAERRQTQIRIRRIFRCGARLARRARLSAFHHGSRQRESSSLRLGFRPGFLGRGLNGRYPPSPVPVQGSTSHPGHSAGRLMPETAREQGVWPHPRAPHSLHLRGVPSAEGVLDERDSLACI